MYIITNTCLNGEYTPSKAETLEEAKAWLKRCTAANIRGWKNEYKFLKEMSDDGVIEWAKCSLNDFEFDEDEMHSAIYYDDESYNIMNIYDISNDGGDTKDSNSTLNKYHIGDWVRTKIHYINDKRTEVNATIIGVFKNDAGGIDYKISFCREERECSMCTSSCDSCDEGYVGEEDIISKVDNYIVNYELTEQNPGKYLYYCKAKSGQEAADICRKKCFENSNDTVLSVAVMVKDWK